jgi:hypothetical protein
VRQPHLVKFPIFTLFFPEPWRTLANQEVILRIGPLGKLGHFESAAEIFLVYIASISLASGPILSITSWHAKVLRAWTIKLIFLYKVEKGGVRSSRFDFLTIERFASFDVSIFLFTKKARPFFVLKKFFLKSQNFSQNGLAILFSKASFLFLVCVKKLV